MTLSVAGSNGGGATGTTNSVTAWPASYTPAAGDIALVIAETDGTAAAWTQTAGSAFTGTGTGGALTQDNNTNATAPFQTLLAWRILQAGDTAPTFHIPNSGRVSWDLLVLRSTATPAIDVVAGPTFHTTAGTSFTPPAATAAGSGETSVVLASITAAAKGTTAETWTAPANWTANSVAGSQAGTTATFSHLSSMATRLSQGPGSVAPGAYTAGVSSFATSYHVLVLETGGGPALAQQAQQWTSWPAVRRAAYW